MNLITLTDIRKSFQVGPTEIPVLHGIDFTAEAGEMISIMGQSGSGKSTLMNIVGMLDQPSSGGYLFEGGDVLAARNDTLSALRARKIGFVFQNYFLLPRLTALENVLLPMMYRGESRSRSVPRARAMLDRVGLGDQADKRPTLMSGGQRQRVAIARALIGDPPLLLCDEPTGALDAQTSTEILDLFVELNRENARTILIITHDPSVAARCRRQVVIADGRLVDDGRARDPAAVA